MRRNGVAALRGNDAPRGDYDDWAERCAAGQAMTATVDMKDLAFSPSTIQIIQGDTVTWTNDEEIMPHDVVVRHPWAARRRATFRLRDPDARTDIYGDVLRAWRVRVPLPAPPGDDRRRDRPAELRLEEGDAPAGDPPSRAPRATRPVPLAARRRDGPHARGAAWPFDRVVTSPLPRCVETAVAMGFALTRISLTWPARMAGANPSPVPPVDFDWDDGYVAFGRLLADGSASRRSLVDRPPSGWLSRGHCRRAGGR